MFQHRREKKELLLLVLFLLFTVSFTAWFLSESGGVLLFPQWKEVDHHLYYQPVARSLLPLFPLLVLVLDGVVVLLTLWGLRCRAYLASFAVCLGTLLLFSITLQAFFSGYIKHLLTLLAGAAAFLAAFWISRIRPTQQTLFKVIPLSQLTAVLIVALAVSCPLLGTQVNGSRAWIYLGPVSLQPGQLLMPLLSFYAASRFPCRDQKQVLPFFLLSILSIFCLAWVRDLGNAAIMVVLMLVACWYLTDRFTLCSGLFFCCVGLLILFLKIRPDLAGRFNCFQGLDSVGSQQYQALCAILHSGLQGSGVDQTGDYLWATKVTFAHNDLISILPLSILGLGAMLLLLLAFTGLILDPARNPAASPYHVVLHSGSVSLLFAQGLLNLGGAYNVLPFTGVCFPLLSTGGSSMVSSFALLGFCLSALVWGGCGVAQTERTPGLRHKLHQRLFSGRCPQ